MSALKTKMTIAIASDHAGFPAKEHLVKRLKAAGYEVSDLGTGSSESVDYPDYASKVARMVKGKRADRGVLVCGTGIGMCIAANKVRGIRAGVVWSPETALLSREHNDTNVVCFSGRFFRPPALWKMLKVWLRGSFDAESRHARRIRKISDLEKRP